MKKGEKTEIKAIIFDLGGVQHFFNHHIAAKKIAKFLNASERKIFKIISDSGDNPGFTKFCETHKSQKDSWKYFMKKMSLSGNPHQKLQDAWNTIFTENKKITALLPKLKKHYKLGLISNISKGHKIHFIKKGIGKHFDVCTYSCDLGVRKPNPKIYRDSLKKLSVRPKEAIFVDDLPRNIKAAKKLGMHGIVYKNHAELLKELKKLGVGW